MVETGSINALSSLAKASCQITQGEFQQIQIAKKPDTSIDDYFEVIGKKTAELFGASCQSGVIVATSDSNLQKSAHDYGYNLGMAFQIIDDLMDFSFSSEQTGKNLGDDFKLGKTTLPIILAWSKSNTNEKKFWNRSIKELKQGPSDLNIALEIFNKYDIFVECQKIAEKFVNKSKLSLENFPNSKIKDYLIGLVDESIYRNN